MHMDDIRKLIQLLEESGLQEIEVTRFWGLGRVRLTKHSGKSSAERQNGAGTNGLRAEAQEPFLPGGSGEPASGPAPLAAPQVHVAMPAIESRFVAIKSPMVGTVYLAANPESPPFVKVGDHVGNDSTICIIEAMKVFNEIPAETTGKIVAVLVENGAPVEFGQPLFRIDPKG